MVSLCFVPDLSIVTNSIYLSYLGFVLLLLNMALQTIWSIFKIPPSSSF